MDCKELQTNIEAYLDKELTLSDRRDIEEHLGDCKNCKAVLENIQSLNVSVQKIGYTKTPFSLRRNIKTGLKDMTGEEEPAFNWTQLLSFGSGSAVLASITVWTVMTFMISPTIQTQIADEMIAAHVRSLMVDHATDISTSDRHVVKPWFNGKLDFSPMVNDHAEDGFPLVGGRLDYLRKQPVAALVYKRRSHFINLFIYRENNSNDVAPLNNIQQHGYNLVNWRKQELNYWAISDLNENELKLFAKLLSEQASGHM